MKLSPNITCLNALKMTTVVALMSLVSVQPQAAGGQQAAAGKTPGPKAVVVAEEEESAAPKKPGVEGIKVHGHWVIDLHNADGTIAEHRDFQNSFIPSRGGPLMASILTGHFAISTLTIVLTSSNGNSYPIAPTNVNQLLGACSPSNTTPCSKTLTTTIDSSNNVVLSGSYQFTAVDAIHQVNTYIIGCVNSNGGGPIPISAAACAAWPDGQAPSGSSTGGDIFTGTAITPLNVAVGQFITVSVTLSFS